MWVVYMMSGMYLMTDQSGMTGEAGLLKRIKGVPPLMDKVKMIRSVISTRTNTTIGEAMEGPWLAGTDKMNYLDGVLELFKGRQIAVGGAESEIVTKWQSSRGITSTPIRKILIKQSLVTTIKASDRLSHLQKVLIRLEAGFADKEARVEAIRPAHIWGSRELIPLLEKFINVFQGQHVSIHKNNLGQIQLIPDLNLGKGTAKFGTPKETQVFHIFGVERIDLSDFIKDC